MQLEIITGTTKFYLKEETAVAIGKFDGVHIGHRRLLEEIISRKADGLKTCVFTFDPAPAVLFGQSDGKELTTREEKRLLFEHMGIDILVEFPLNLETAGISPENFVTEILVEQMCVKFIAAGSDLSFGAKGAGNAALLKSFGKEYDYEVKIIDKVYYEGKEVSSTYLRGLVEAGNMELAEKLLGMPYCVTGRVVHGNRIGRTIGFPTINLIPEESKLLPPNGVYYSEVRFHAQSYRAISNVGYKPTVTKEHVLGVESYLYDFAQEIYEEAVEVYLCGFRRPEMQFEGLEALKNQLKEDIEAGALWHRS